MANPTIIQMLIDAPEQIDQIDTSIANLDAQILDLQTKQNALEVDVCNKTGENLESYLCGEKFTPSENYYMYKGPTFDLPLDPLGTLTDWKVYEKQSVSDLLYFTDNSFTCSGDQTLIFTPSLDFSALINSTTFVYSLVSSSSYDLLLDQTTVNINDSVLNITLESVWLFHYTYLLGDDSVIDDFNSTWIFGQDYILHPIGVNATYGTQDMIAKLNIAKTMMGGNKAKLEESIIKLAPFK